ncbi:copper resistance protein B [Sphingomonas cavernae]|uniref:Copper resistance protein B n=1 Tax=Sphingomonas cavernae TaxID=2320861 RepID=A0A418WRM2_9SPHN|nr:copper resistance protein B [Sphingomonas cavernae]RJF93799.1 copper resistance protein B [Sphingomonas cavernae]
MKPLLLLAGGSLLALAAPAAAQASQQAQTDCPPEHAAMGHCKPAPAQKTPPSQTKGSPAADPHAGHAMPNTGEQVPQASNSHAGHDMSDMERTGEKMPGHDAGGTALPAGDAPAPTAPEPDYADTVWGEEAMSGSRRQLRKEHGGGTFAQVMLNLAEYRVHKGRDGFLWDAEGWFGGDINRLVVKTEGSGAFGDGVEDAEIQALYARAIGPYFNLQAGVRYDISPDPSRTYATIGFEGLAPYWFEVEGALFLSDKGDVLGRLEGYYDQRITQRWILQPRAELNFAAQDVPETGIGSGLSDVELGLRLRYEIAREFAPYIGVSWDRRIGDTARFARAAGDDVEATSFVMGVRAWF